MISIYGLKCNKTNMLYIGSTKMTLMKRLYVHKNKKDCRSYKIIDNNDYIIYEIEKCDENMRDIREQYWLDNTDNINFKNVMGRNKEKLKLNSKKYRDNNKENKKKYHQDNKEKIKIYKNIYISISVVGEVIKDT